MSSRLIIKNLPSYLTSDQLREHILTAPTSSTKVNISTNLTDLNLVKDKQGISRRFAFLGFTNHEVANAVREYFDKTYIHTSRIMVNFAKEIGDEELKERKERFREIARANRDGEKERQEQVIQAQREERGQKIKQEKKKQKDKGKQVEGAAGAGKQEDKGVSFDDFLSIMAPGNMRRKKENEKLKELNDKELEEASTLEKQVRDKKEKQKRKEERKRKREEKQEREQAHAARDEDQDQVQDEEEVEKDKAVNDEGLTDLEYMYRRMRKNLEMEKHEGEDGSREEDKKGKKKEKDFEQSDDENQDSSSEESSDESDVESDSSESKARKQRQSQLEARRERQREEEAERKLKEEDAVMRSSRLFVRNLPFGCKEEDLKEWFEDDRKGGEVTEVHIPVDRSTKQSKGLGFVKFSNPSHALAALRNKDGAIFQGRLLHILAAVNQSSEPANEEEPLKKKKETLKQERFNQRKEAAGSKKAEFEWSMLYMNQDSVATSIADRLGISKSEILNPSSEDERKGETSAAVKLALAETHLIKETRDWLEREGLDLDSISSNSKKSIRRSDTTILVKNFPFGTRKEELEEMFSVHGEVERLEMSPSGTIALVGMINENEARKAFKNVAYKRFGGGILYLEKAPERNEAYGKRKRQEEESRKKESQQQQPDQEPVKLEENKTKEAIEAEQAQAEAESVATLYIKNLNFSTTTEDLSRAFQGLTDFTFARVQTKPSVNGTARLSMGYGFVGFRSFNSASAAMKVMNGKSLDGHALTISFAKRGQESTNSKACSGATSGASSSTATKILVKNLPFEATKQDVRALFQSHANVKSVRAPRKLGGKNSGARGFAFVEFHSNKEAKMAMEALKFTHLLGRHLVLTFADDDAGIEMEMAKSKARLGLGSKGGEDALGSDTRKRKKVRLGEQDIQDAVAKEREAMEVDSE